MHEDTKGSSHTSRHVNLEAIADMVLQKLRQEHRAHIVPPEEPSTLERTFVKSAEGITQLVHARTRQMESCGVRSARNIVHIPQRPALRDQKD